MSGPIYFAIGDVHGLSDRLGHLHEAILDNIIREQSAARIIHLGDYVDRGPDSRGVIDRIIALERAFAGNPDIDVISLKGNHEEMMLSQIGGVSETWLGQGGRETLASYGVDPAGHRFDWADLLPQDHLDWLMNLPTLYHDAQRRMAFVHAGIDPHTFPACGEQVRMWTRSPGFTDIARWPDRPELAGLRVVHGHTPVNAPEIHPHRINVDTGAVYGGDLTAVMLAEGATPRFLRA
jgi:serine/threonine protein phosphatase 1